MEYRQIAQGIIDFHKIAFDSWFATFSMLQDHTTKTIGNLLDKANLIPSDGSKVIQSWTGLYKNERTRFKSFIDSGFAAVERAIIEPVESVQEHVQSVPKTIEAVESAHVQSVPKTIELVESVQENTVPQTIEPVESVQVQSMPQTIEPVESVHVQSVPQTIEPVQKTTSNPMQEINQLPVKMETKTLAKTNKTKSINKQEKKYIKSKE
jgi:hypothetical protein